MCSDGVASENADAGVVVGRRCALQLFLMSTAAMLCVWVCGYGCVCVCVESLVYTLSVPRLRVRVERQGAREARGDWRAQAQRRQAAGVESGWFAFDFRRSGVAWSKGVSVFVLVDCR